MKQSLKELLICVKIEENLFLGVNSKMSETLSSEKQIVLVTGASGCLGQHIVKLLQERDDSVKEIRCLDLKPYQNNLREFYSNKIL